MKKLLFYLILVLGLNSYAQINVSTGIDATQNALSIGVDDPLWKIASSPNPPGTPAKATSSYGSFWEPTPVATTNARWINSSGGSSDLAGTYIYERDFTVTSATNTINCNFSVAWDDVLISLELVRPNLTTIPLTVTPTTSYHLSVPITNTIIGAGAGTWKIRATTSITFQSGLDIGGFLLSGNVSLSYVNPPDCGNTFVKEINPLDATKPNIFKIPNGDFYTTSSYFPNVIINRFDTNGTMIWTKSLNFGISDSSLAITDLIVDASDNQIVGLANSATGTIIFKYDEVTNTFTWINRTGNQRAFNIHETSSTMYTITGSDAASNIEIFKVNQSTGTIGGYQKQGMTGEFYSTYDSGNVYGSCRYYADSGSQFFPSMYKYDATGTNVWTKTYVRDTPTARLYPVAPIVDGSSLVELIAGNDDNFNLFTDGTAKIWLLKTDLNGTLNWTKEITVSGYTGFEPIKIINATDGYYLVVNRYTSSGQRNLFFVIKTDKNGEVLWANRYGLPTTENYVTGGYEKGGFLYLTGMSTTYSAISHMVLLKLNNLGKTDTSCPFINSVTATSSVYANVETPRPTVNNFLSLSTTSMSGTNTSLTYTETVQCSLPCETLCSSFITPTFNPISPLCSTTTLSPLPTVSTNGITGVWSPAFTNTATTTYTFTPDAGQCATTTTLTVTITPAITWYQDADSDGAGNPAVFIVACIQPTGYVNNDNDCDDTNAAISPCANENTTDGIDNNCNGFIDEIVTKLVASDCNITLLAMNELIVCSPISGNCGYKFKVTKWVPIAPYSTILVPSINPADIQISGIRTTNTFALTMLPQYAYNTTYTVQVSVCVGGVWQPYGAECCTITTPSVIPSIRPADCGITVSSMNQQVYANFVGWIAPAPDNWRFEVTNPTASTTEFVDNDLREFRFNDLTLYPATYNTTYSIRVAFLNKDGIWTAFGPACNVSTPTVMPTQIVAAQCGFTATSGSQIISATTVTSSLGVVSNYEFKLSNASQPYSQTKVNSSNTFFLNQFTGLLTNTTYKVEVRVKVLGYWSTYGTVCTITTPGVFRFSETKDEFVSIENTFAAVGYPNPYNDIFHIKLTTASIEPVSIKIYDLLGKVVEEHTIDVNELDSYSFGIHYPSGVYNTILRQGEQITSVRLIKK